MKETQIIDSKTLSTREKSMTILKTFCFETDPVNLLKKIKENSGSEKKITESTNSLLDLARVYENESQVALMESLDGKYRSLAREMTQTIILEQNCITEIEKGLAELTVNAYIRVLDNSRRINNEFNAGTITPNRTLYIAQLSKQIDRSNRQYIQAILTLSQIKNPIIKMNIKAETAFISQNQQINNNENNNIN